MSDLPSAGELPECIEVQTADHPRAAVIWLHGLGADGHDFEPIVPELGPLPLPVRFVFPHAPMQPVTINGGAVMRAWYDIASADLVRREDERGVRASQRALEALIAREQARGIERSRIVIAGFSQGGAIVLQSVIRQSGPLAGAMALSTYLPLSASAATEATPAGCRIPIFFGHGSYDNVVQPQRALASRDQLLALGCPLEWHEYPMPHSVCAQEVRDMAAWLARVLGGAA
jgi:phospholipase/carboxylesterase